VVVAMGVGWWIEHDRYRLVREVAVGLQPGDRFEIGVAPDGRLIGGFTRRGSQSN